MRDASPLELPLQSCNGSRVHREFTFYTICGAVSTHFVEGGSLSRNVPFAKAVEYVGDDALRRAGTSAKGLLTAYGNWKNQRGVPWHIVGPLLREQLIHRQRADAATGIPLAPMGSTSRTLAHAEVHLVAHEFVQAQEQLWRIFNHFGADSTAWRSVMGAMETADKERLRADKPAPTPAGRRARQQRARPP
jgi:hypothetical protein